MSVPVHKSDGQATGMSEAAFPVYWLMFQKPWGRELAGTGQRPSPVGWIKGESVDMDHMYFHRAFGVYGICQQETKKLVIKKNGGPYIHREDMPGGSLEHGEDLAAALHRAFREETGYEIEILENIGVKDFKLPWTWKDYNDVHHIAVYDLVRIIGGKIMAPDQFDGQDALGAVWIHLYDVNIDNASPLVLKAVKWFEEKRFDIEVSIYEDWKVKG